MPPSPQIKIGSNNGYSVFSFSILYLLARTIRFYGLPEWFKKYSPLIYIVCSVLTGLFIHITVISGHEDMVELPLSYINPLIIISSVAFLMMFERINIQSRVINHLAKSTLAVLLGHTAIFFLYTKQFKYLYDHITGIEVVCYWILAIALVFVSSVLIDQIRLLMWRPLNGWFKKHIIKDNIIQ